MLGQIDRYWDGLTQKQVVQLQLRHLLGSRSRRRLPRLHSWTTTPRSDERTALRNNVVEGKKTLQHLQLMGVGLRSHNDVSHFQRRSQMSEGDRQQSFRTDTSGRPTQERQWGRVGTYQHQPANGYSLYQLSLVFGKGFSIDDLYHIQTGFNSAAEDVAAAASPECMVVGKRLSSQNSNYPTSDFLRYTSVSPPYRQKSFGFASPNLDKYFSLKSPLTPTRSSTLARPSAQARQVQRSSEPALAALHRYELIRGTVHHGPRSLRRKKMQSRRKSQLQVRVHEGRSSEMVEETTESKTSLKTFPVAAYRKMTSNDSSDDDESYSSAEDELLERKASDQTRRHYDADLQGSTSSQDNVTQTTPTAPYTHRAPYDFLQHHDHVSNFLHKVGEDGLAHDSESASSQDSLRVFSGHSSHRMLLASSLSSIEEPLQPNTETESAHPPNQRPPSVRLARIPAKHPIQRSRTVSSVNSKQSVAKREKTSGSLPSVVPPEHPLPDLPE